MPSTQFPPIVSYDLTVNITSGQTISTIIDLSGTTLCGLYLPSNFTGTGISLQSAASASGPFVNVLSGGSAFSVTGAASTYVPIEAPAVLSGVRFLQLTAGTAQSSSVTLTLAVRPL